MSHSTLNITVLLQSNCIGKSTGEEYMDGKGMMGERTNDWWVQDKGIAQYKTIKIKDSDIQVMTHIFPIEVFIIRDGDLKSLILSEMYH